MNNFPWFSFAIWPRRYSSINRSVLRVYTTFTSGRRSSINLPSFKTIPRVISFSRVPMVPSVPGSLPPCPASSTMTSSFHFFRCVSSCAWRLSCCCCSCLASCNCFASCSCFTSCSCRLRSAASSFFDGRVAVWTETSRSLLVSSWTISVVDIFFRSLNEIWADVGDWTASICSTTGFNVMALSAEVSALTFGSVTYSQFSSRTKRSASLIFAFEWMRIR